nr:hypothetical protein [Tanacetum cinerariifolium]
GLFSELSNEESVEGADVAILLATVDECIRSGEVSSGIHRSGNYLYAFSCEELAQIHRISFPGYGILVRIK